MTRYGTEMWRRWIAQSGQVLRTQAAAITVARRTSHPICAAAQLHHAAVFSSAQRGSSTGLVVQAPLSAQLLCSAHRFSKAVMGWLVGLMLFVVSSGVGIVWCRPLDTPPYLMPYYLRDVRSRFNHYASVQKRGSRAKYMTVDDFVLAVLASPDKELRNKDASVELKELFAKFDTNGDGFISFSEFRLLMCLLVSKPDELKVLFRVADYDSRDSITLEQFATVVRGVTDDEAVTRYLLSPRVRKNGLIASLFGSEEVPRRCPYNELHDAIHEIKVEIWKTEFRQFDVDRTDSISADEFGELIGNQVLGTHLPSYIASNIKKLHGSQQRITLSTWISFHELMSNAVNLVKPIEIYTAAGLPITRTRFHRALKAAQLPTMSDKTVDLLFAVFDRNNDGTMEMDEFLYIIQKKINYHYSAPTREKKSLPSRFVECTKDLIQGA